MREMLCFGGPKNGQVMTVDDYAPVAYAAVPTRLSVSAYDNVSPTAPTIRTGIYRVEKVGAHFNVICDAPIHSYCRWSAQCLVYDGYPTHRITDALNAIYALTYWCSWI